MEVFLIMASTITCSPITGAEQSKEKAVPILLAYAAILIIGILLFRYSSRDVTNYRYEIADKYGIVYDKGEELSFLDDTKDKVCGGGNYIVCHSPYEKNYQFSKRRALITESEMDKFKSLKATKTFFLVVLLIVFVPLIPLIELIIYIIVGILSIIVKKDS